MYTKTLPLDLIGNRYVNSRSAYDPPEAQSVLVAYPEISKQGASLLDTVLQRDPTSRPTADALVRNLPLQCRSHDKVEKSIAERRRAFSAVNSVHASCDANVAALENDLASCDTKVVALENDLASCDAKVIALENDLASRDAEVAALENDKLQREAAHLAHISKLEERCRAAEERQSELEADAMTTPRTSSGSALVIQLPLLPGPMQDDADGGGEAGGPPLKDDPNFANFFKMLKIGLPRGIVEIKMRTEGADPAVLDMDPTKPLLTVSGALKSPSAAPPPTAGRLPLKVNDKPAVPLRSLFWTKIPDHEIASTIWKELSDAAVDIDTEALTSRFANIRPRASAYDESLGARDGTDNAPNDADADGGASGEGGVLARLTSAKLKKTERITLLNPMVRHKVGILLAKLRMECNTIRAAMLSLGDVRFGTPQLEVRGRSKLRAEWCSVPQFSRLVFIIAGGM